MGRLLKKVIRALVPAPLLSRLLPIYHFLLAFLGACVYRFPSRNLYVIGVTGTKGKSTTTELIATILKEAGHSVAYVNTIQFKIGGTTERNLFKMSMPGRFFLQRFLYRARKAGCTHAVLEMTSEGATLYRHRFISLNALVFTNLTPEHIESHGSFEKYRDAKLSIRDALSRSRKPEKIIVANADDPHGALFLKAHVQNRLTYTLAEHDVHSDSRSSTLTFQGVAMRSHLPGMFNASNILAAATLTFAMGIDAKTIKSAVEKVEKIAGRAEHIDEGQAFEVVVDYAHTPESLEALYKTFRMPKICVLGNTGGGRDAWKRPLMAKIAEQNCARIVLTNEDPYDEDPLKIIDEMVAGMKHRPEVILDRREAIARALSIASRGDAVLITGKGTDPFIMGPRGSKKEWSDTEVVREELQKLNRAVPNVHND